MNIKHKKESYRLIDSSLFYATFPALDRHIATRLKLGYLFAFPLFHSPALSDRN
ncbi:hypothetical protein FM107_04840 [Sphingobacterium sp. JB170]|nr:hypothetical protein FM107_04840 [Sphingobacterium sp. JB170]